MIAAGTLPAGVLKLVILIDAIRQIVDAIRQIVDAVRGERQLAR